MKVNKTLLATLTIIGGLIFDQYTKNLVVGAAINKALPIEVTSFFDIGFAWNTGISFSLFSSSGPMTKFILTGFALLLSLVLLIWLLREKLLLPKMGFGLIIAGAVGNALDRIRYGAVIDFLDFHYTNWHFPTFNVADVLINLGVVLILIQMFFYSSDPVAKKSDNK